MASERFRIGATVSTTSIGFLAQSFSFTIAFAVLAAVAVRGVATLWFFMPDTAKEALGDDWLAHKRSQY